MQSLCDKNIHINLNIFICCKINENLHSLNVAAFSKIYEYQDAVTYKYILRKMNSYK